jgi:uncharacterized DUF497 family protein
VTVSEDALSKIDDIQKLPEHSEREERWITIGIDENGILLIASHTFQIVDNFRRNIRIISARKSVKREIKQYKEWNP